MIVREILSIHGLDKTSDAFRRKLVEVADSLVLDPSYLAAVIAFESGFSPAAKNPRSGAVGLIQFMPDEPDKPGKPGRKGSASMLGTSVEALETMSGVQQLDYVQAFYRKIIDWKGPIETLEDHYLAVFAPAFVGKPPETVVYAKPSEKYLQNKELDKSGDGTITAEEATGRVRAIYDAAKNLPPILVDMDAPSSEGGSVGIVGAALVVAILAWGFSSYKHKAKLA